MNYLFWYNTIPNASAVLLRRGILNTREVCPMTCYLLVTL